MPYGEITYVTVGWTVDTPDGPQQAVISLESMRKHCRAERVGDLLDDLQILCEDVQEARDAAGRRDSSRLRVLR